MMEVKSENGKNAVKKEFEGFHRCLELEDKFKKLKEKCATLELDMEKKNTALESLEDKLSFSELHKFAIEDEVRILKERNKELERIIENGENANDGVVDLMEDGEDNVTQLLIENRVLNCEKKKSESEGKMWEAKYKELELLVMELHGKMSTGMVKRGSILPEIDLGRLGELVRIKDGMDGGARPTPVQTRTKDKANEPHHVSDRTPCTELTRAEEEERGIPCETKLKNGSQVKKRLGFAEESPNKKMAPLTPGGTVPSIGPIDISDSDNEPNPNQLQGKEKVCGSFDGGSRVTVDKRVFPSKDRCSRVLEYSSDEEVLHTSTSKRKRASNIVTSESETDDDDDSVPICRLKSKSLDELDENFHVNSYSVKDTDSMDKFRKPVTRRHLVRLGKIEKKGGSAKCKFRSAGPTNDTFEGDEMEEDESDSEGESLGGFIVNDSDISEGSATTIGDNISEGDGPCSNEDSSGESENASQGGASYDEIISVFRRARKHKKWDFEADMLADFGKHPELCMTAVCALYRQQTSMEKSSKSALVLNGRGFSQCDAFKGSALAEFLTDGDLQGDVKKSVEELQEYNPRGAELCRKLATHYSKQLFAIYKNEEDPFFRPL